MILSLILIATVPTSTPAAPSALEDDGRPIPCAIASIYYLSSLEGGDATLEQVREVFEEVAGTDATAHSIAEIRRVAESLGHRSRVLDLGRTGLPLRQPFLVWLNNGQRAHFLVCMPDPSKDRFLLLDGDRPPIPVSPDTLIDMLPEDPQVGLILDPEPDPTISLGIALTTLGASMMVASLVFRYGFGLGAPRASKS